MKIRAPRGKVLVSNLERGARVIKGIIIPDDNGKSEGIRPRWGQIYAVGTDVKDVKVGQWVLVEHGRWTRGMKITQDNGSELQLWGVEHPESTLLVSDEDPETEIYSKWA